MKTSQLSNILKVIPSETPRESDNSSHTPEVDFDLLRFRQSVELKFKSTPDLDNVNLSDHMLSTAQLEILNKGLKFCLTPGEAQMGVINCSQRVITDFFTSETPRESDNSSHTPEVDFDLLRFRQSVELKFKSTPDLENVINLSDHMHSPTLDP